MFDNFGGNNVIKRLVGEGNGIGGGNLELAKWRGGEALTGVANSFWRSVDAGDVGTVFG